MTLLSTMMSTYHSMAEPLAATLTAELISMFVVGKVEVARLAPTSPKKANCYHNNTKSNKKKSVPALMSDHNSNSVVNR